MIPQETVDKILDSAQIVDVVGDFVSLKSGDVVLQNDASSTVGLAVIELCKARGIKTINVVKDCGKGKNDLCQPANQAGGDVVIRETQLQSNVGEWGECCEA